MRIEHLWVQALIVPTIWFCGCDRSVLRHDDVSESNVPADVVDLIREFPEDKNISTIKKTSELIILRIKEYTNNAAKVKALDMWVDRLSDLDVSDLKYEEQRDVIVTINDIFIYNNAIVQWLGWLENSYEKAFAAQLKVLSWHRAQIERLKPQRRINFEKLTREDAVRYLSWRKCYMSIVGYYEHTVRRMERVELPIACKGVSEAEKTAIIKNVEKFLGRRIRSPQEAEAAKGEFTSSNEMESVRKREIGP